MPTLKPCGTVAAYQRHRRNKEEPCEACLQALRENSRERRVARPPHPEKAPLPCGTDAAYQRHVRRREISCDPCLLAHREACRKFRAKNGTAPRTRQPCGTYAAYQYHLSHDEEVCDPCRHAMRAYYRDKRAREREELRQRPENLETWQQDLAARVLANMAKGGA